MKKKDVFEAVVSHVEFPNKGIVYVDDHKVVVKKIQFQARRSKQWLTRNEKK